MRAEQPTIEEQELWQKVDLQISPLQRALHLPREAWDKAQPWEQFKEKTSKKFKIALGVYAVGIVAICGVKGTFIWTEMIEKDNQQSEQKHADARRAACAREIGNRYVSISLPRDPVRIASDLEICVQSGSSGIIETLNQASEDSGD